MNKDFSSWVEKYRPTTLDEISAQEDVIKSLKYNPVVFTVDEFPDKFSLLSSLEQALAINSIAKSTHFKEFFISNF